MVFDQVQIDLETAGYEVLPLLLPASSLNAPHRRDRIWFVAHSNGHDAGGRGHGEVRRPSKEFKAWDWSEFERIGKTWDVTNSNGLGLRRQGDGIRNSNLVSQISTGDYWQNFPTQSPVCDGDDGLPTELDGITIPKWKRETISAGGNAVVPQLVYEIYKAIEQYEKLRA